MVGAHIISKNCKRKYCEWFGGGFARKKNYSGLLCTMRYIDGRVRIDFATLDLSATYMRIIIDGAPQFNTKALILFMY